MYRAISVRLVFSVMQKTWPMFCEYNTLKQVLRDGWTINVFYENDVPYVWRSNLRIDEGRFWQVVESVFAGIDEPNGVLLFHDGHAGWKRGRVLNVKNGVAVPTVNDALHLLRRGAFYSRRQWNYGEDSDNYNMVLAMNKAFVSFTHHGELICFSEDAQWLSQVKHRFNAFRLVCHIEPNDKDNEHE